MPSVMIYVLSSQTRGSKSLGSTTDANVNMERNLKDSVVCGVKGYAQGAPVESHMPAFRGMPFCNVSVVCSLFVHHRFQTQTAVSTRKSCLLMEAGCCPSTAGSLEGGSQC